MTAYADSSFLVSLYLPDAHSPRARRLVSRSRPSFYLTPLHELEVINAVGLAVFRKLVRPAEARAVLQDFEKDRNSLYVVTHLSSDTFGVAERLARTHTAVMGTRSLDILHVAAALMQAPDAFFSFDDRQRRLARKEGLRVLPA